MSHSQVASRQGEGGIKAASWFQPQQNSGDSRGADLAAIASLVVVRLRHQHQALYRNQHLHAMDNTACPVPQLSRELRRGSLAVQMSVTCHLDQIRR